MKRDVVDPDEIISAVMAEAGKSVVDAAVLYDVAEALLAIGRPDLGAEYARRAYGLAILENDPQGASRAVALMVMKLGPDGRRVLSEL